MKKPFKFGVVFCTSPTSINYECESCKAEFEVPGDFDYDYGSGYYFRPGVEPVKCEKCPSLDVFSK